MDYVLELHVEWQKYENPGQSLSDILHDIYRIPLGATDSYGHSFTTVESKGTRLIIQGLKDDWSESFLSDLKKELSLLVSPFSGINDFHIELKTGIAGLDGFVSATQMLGVADWIIDAELDSDEQVTVTVRSDRYKEKYIDGPHVWKEWIKDRGEHPESGPFKFNMFFMTRDTPNLKQLNLRKKDLKEFLEINQGIRIYRDNFRVRPYGEPSGKGDWLDMGLRRAKNPEGISQKGWVVGPHQVVGAVFIGRENNPNLEDQTNREGIVEGTGFYNLRAAILKAISYFEDIAHKVAVQRNEPRPSTQAKEEAERAVSDAREKANRLKQRFREVTTAIDTEPGNKADELHELFKEVEDYTASVEEIAKATENVEKVYAEEARELEADKDTLANLASLGILTVCFGHEAKEYSNLAAANAALLNDIYKDGHLPLMPPYDGSFEKSIEILINSTDFVRSFASFALGNVRLDKRRLTAVKLTDVIDTVFKAMGKSLERQKIHVDLTNIPNDIAKIRAFKIDWESILINLLTNSIAAMQDTPAAQRKISVGLREAEDNVILTFADSGVGLEAETEMRIFEPMFSTRRDRKGNTDGTGMGLAIVKTFVEEHSKGTIAVISPGFLGGAEFEIKVPAILHRRDK